MAGSRLRLSARAASFSLLAEQAKASRSMAASAVPDMPELLYRIVMNDDLGACAAGSYKGGQLDWDTKMLHLSTAEQVPG